MQSAQITSNQAQSVHLFPQSILSTEKVEQKALITRAFRKGRLSLRVVSQEESTYLNHPQKDPRPVYMVREDIPVSMRPTSCDTVAIINPKPLFLYKENAFTSRLCNTNKQPDELEVKCQPSMDALQTKMTEQSERTLWGVYLPATSGHLKEDGTFTLPKYKRSGQTISHSEVVTTGYEREQIVCYCIGSRDYRTFNEVLSDKHNLERQLALNTLPLAVYTEKSGTLQVWFEEELITPNSCFATNEKIANYGPVSQCTDSEMFRNALSLLPFPEQTQLLDSLATPTPVTDSIVEAVTRPDKYCATALKDYVARGGRIDKPFTDSQGESYQSLGKLFLDTERARCFNALIYDTRNRTSAFLSNETTKNAVALFDELIRCGMTIDPEEFSRDWAPVISLFPHLFDRFVALGIYRQFDKEYDSASYYLYPDGAGATYAHLQNFLSLNEQQRQSQLKGLLINPITNHGYFPDNYEQLLMMLCYFNADPRPFKEELIETLTTIKSKHEKKYFRMLGLCSPEGHVNHILSLWENSKHNKHLIDWIDKFEQASSKINALRDSLQPTTDQHVRLAAKRAINALSDKFSQPPTLTDVGDNEKTVHQILQHYYRRPGAERLGQAAKNNHPAVWKPLHSCNHVLRARNNAHWYMELLEKFDLAHFDEVEKTLLALAMIYHDAAAEDVDKKDEENRSAFYFERDMVGHFPEETVKKVADALRRKEDDTHDSIECDLDKQLRNYIRVLRFGDRMDFVRCSGVKNNFPYWDPQEKSCSWFNSDMLDLPPEALNCFSNDPELKTPFQRELEACMHGAVDLAAVSGGRNTDQRVKGDYAVRHGLRPYNGQLADAFERTPEPLTRMGRILDDNVRRMIAELADIKTCDAREHIQCRADVQTGVCHGIHNSWHDLQQVRIPVGMSLAEKMQCEHDISGLSLTTLQEIGKEVTRLRQEGIAMNLGTLTQKTLKSEVARAVLDKRGFTVVSEERQCGFDQFGKPNNRQMLVHKKRPF